MRACLLANPGPVCIIDQLSRPEEQGIMICVLTIVSGASVQQSTQQQKLSDIPRAQIYLAGPWRIADISGNVAFVIHPGQRPWEILNNCRN